MAKIIWDEIFVDGKIKRKVTREELCIVGILGWANCRLEKAPDQFGYGMSAIAQELGIPATEVNLKKKLEQIRQG